MSLIIPSKLKKGDKVSVVATARVTDRAAVEEGCKILETWGLEVVPGESLYGSHHMFAGTDQQRLYDLQSALDEENTKAIFCARGGYGTTRILDRLVWEGFRQSPKWVCGFSDVTSLLCQVHSLGFACLHSSMVQLFNGKGRTQDNESLRLALFEHKALLTSGPHPENNSGYIEGMFVGGNLSLLVHLIGTSTEVETDGKILILEEVDEYLYHLDRMMIQLGRSGKLQRLAGVAVGHLTRMKEGDLKFGRDAAGVIKSHFTHTNIPIGFGLPFGHQSPNLAIPIGVNGKLEVTNAGSRITSEY